MSEIEKLYKKAGVEKMKLFSARMGINPNVVIYPPFTAGKQLELIRWLVNNNLYGNIFQKHIDFMDEHISSYLNAGWDVFTDTEKQEIKEILEGNIG